MYVSKQVLCSLWSSLLFSISLLLYRFFLPFLDPSSHLLFICVVSFSANPLVTLFIPSCSSFITSLSFVYIFFLFLLSSSFSSILSVIHSFLSSVFSLSKPHFTSNLVIISCQTMLFPCLCPLHSADCTCIDPWTRVTQRYTYTNTKEVLLSCDVTCQSGSEMRFTLHWLVE